MNVPILVVEENDTLRAVLGDWLQAALPGCRPIKAASAEEAVALARAQAPRLILMSTDPARENSIEATRQLKAVAPAAALVALATYDGKQYREEVASAGAEAFVPKWKIRTELAATLKALLAAQEGETVEANRT